MTTLQLLQSLHAAGVVLKPYPDGTLRYKAPKGTMTPALRDGMRQHKAALHTGVEAFEQRAALAEYCGGLARRKAEQVAWQCVLGELPEQAPRTPIPVHRGDER